MLRALFAASLVALLAGCASVPEAKQPPASKSQSAKARPATVKPAPVEAATPNQQVKARWYDRFLKHKSK
jgi:uncharacterized lipoprotein